MFCSRAVSIGNVYLCILFRPTRTLDRPRYRAHHLHVGSLPHLRWSLFVPSRLVCRSAVMA